LIGYFKLNWSFGLTLHDGRMRDDIVALRDITNAKMNQVTSPQLAVDRQIEQCQDTNVS
jgi:hypothetical protein